MLQSRYYFEQNLPNSNNTDHTTSTHNDQETHASTANAKPDTTQTTPTPIVSSQSLQCTRLMMETAVRVVELLPHPLGRNELVVVVEFVHNNSWSMNTRFVALDAFQLGQAILLAGQPPPPFLSRIDILDSQVSIEFCCVLISMFQCFNVSEFQYSRTTCPCPAAF